MILLFLGDWRPTIVISISIPLSIFVSVLLLSALGETINIMTLGGLALAVGILVDDATVEIENIERNLAQGKEMKQAILDGAPQIAVPAFVSTLSICIVFVPMFFLTGVARYLFVPLAEAVVFAMLASYFLSRTLIPTLVMYIMRGHEHREAGAENVLRAFSAAASNAASTSSATAITSCWKRRWSTASCSRLASWPSACCRWGWCSSWARISFPAWMPARCACTCAPAPACAWKRRRACATRSRAISARRFPKDELVTILDNIGLPNSGINLSYSNSGVIGTSDAEILVGLNQEHHHPTADYIHSAARESAAAISGRGVLLPAGRHRHPDSELRPARAHRHSADRPRHGGRTTTIAQQISNRVRRFPARPTCTCSRLLESADAAPGHSIAPASRRWA